MEYRSFHQNSRQDLSKYGLNYSLACCSNIAVDGKSKILGKSSPETGRLARTKATGTVNTKNGCGSLVGSMHDRCWPKYCSHHRYPIYRTLVHKGLSYKLSKKSVIHTLQSSRTLLTAFSLSFMWFTLS